jgi:hypothetical protein
VEDQLKPPVVIIGIGEMAGVFARGLLRLGHPVYPVTRQSGDLASLARAIPVPTMVLVAVGESDLATVLEVMPEAWRDRLALLQNELLPGDFAALTEPTVISVWFEKKKGQDSKVIIPSPVYGKHAQAVADALESIGIAARVLADEAALLHELVLKNVYILTTNIAGLEVGGNVGELWEKHNSEATAVANEVIRLQEVLTGETLDHDALIDGMVAAFEGDREHMCMGRSAPARLQRALVLAAENKLSLLMLERISTL